MKKPSLLLLMLTLAVIGTRAADSEPPHFTPISWILATKHNGDVDDKFVTLQGKVIKPDNGSDWWFSDTTGSVRLDAGDKDLPVGPVLVVSGHIDHAKLGIGYLEVEVSHWTYADKRK
jgi:hypothetical protein